jgi:aspartyl protease family protein
VNNDQQEIEQQKRMGLTMHFLAWFVLLGLGFFFFKDLLQNQYNPNQNLSTRQSSEGTKEVVLQRNRFGHYVTAGEINGKPVTFMLDTGATGVAIPTDVASRLGLKHGRAYRTQTANGMGTSYSATLEEVSVGGIELTNIAAGITPGLRTEEVLLGMSFLKHIEFTQRGDTLTLRQ